MKVEEATRRLIRDALKEDIGTGDVTTFFCVSPRKKTKALILSKEKGILCGIRIAREVFRYVDPSLKFKILIEDGARIHKNQMVAEIKGRAVSILAAERVALNFLSLLSGIATLTRRFVEAVGSNKAKIMDTRKTTPMLRILEKYAVRVGGGLNHRKGLWDGILIKDNHLKVSGLIYKKRFNKKALAQIIEIIRNTTRYQIEIEVENLNQFKTVAGLRPDIILLDNFDLKTMRKAVSYRNRYYPKVMLEASGGVNLCNVRKIARTGVDFISVGSITHSLQSLDFSLEIVD
jgi:nicotinate-nucleotide pyrophosphorylase (carboxylating)